MKRKFVFILCLIFYSCENVSSYKAESVSLPIKKFQSLINSSASDVLKTNQGKDVFPANQGNVQNVSNYSWGYWNTSPNHTKSPQAYFGNKNIITKKEKGIALPRNDSAFVKKLYETLSTNVPNVSLFGLPVNTTIPGENVQPKMMKHGLVGKPSEKENIASSSTIHANMIENEPTKGSPRKRWARAKTDAVDSVIDKLFGEDFSERGRKRQRQPDASRERSSRRRQKMKKPERFGEGEVFYFRDAETTATTGAETTASGGAETTASGGAETTASGGAESTASGGEATTTSGGEETTASGGEETTASGGEETTASGGEETTASGGEETTASGGEETTASGGEETTASGGEETTASGGEETTASGGAETTTASGTEITTSSGTKTTSNSGLLEDSGLNVNRHYHFHYFGVSPPQKP